MMSILRRSLLPTFQSMALVLSCAAGLVIGSALADESVAEVVVVGTVVDERGRAVTHAMVTFLRGVEPLTFPHAVSLEGRFELTLPAQPTHVTVRVEADGFETRLLTRLVSDSLVDLRTVVLDKSPTLSVDRPTVTHSADAMNVRVDVLITNPNETSWPIRELVLRGAKKKVTTCFDIRPAIELQIAQDGTKLVVETLDSEGTVVDRQVAHGKAHVEPCDQVRLEVSVRRFVDFGPGERIWIRFVLPIEMSTADGERVPLVLDDWKVLEVAAL